MKTITDKQDILTTFSSDDLATELTRRGYTVLEPLMPIEFDNTKFDAIEHLPPIEFDINDK